VDAVGDYPVTLDPADHGAPRDSEKLRELSDAEVPFLHGGFARARVEVGGREMVLFVAFEPILRRIVYMRFFEAANMLTALTFIKRVKALYRSRMKVLTDGAQYYRTACKFLSLDHDVYDLRLRNFMERMVQYIKDRTKDFDDYIPCRKERCDKRHAQMLLSSIGFMINEVCLSKGFDLKEFLEGTISAIEGIKNA